ncbi:MAG: glycosyltransferase family 2 protein [Verrucomicrobia bacterium]|nr:glycosyltransferase family 2 protein [Verrucomicrobiota bacterium]
MKVQYEQRGHFHCAPVPPGPCLAVLMPCFNESRTVGEIAHRVLAQEVVAQLVIVDDGSTDGTWEHLQVLSKDGRVQILKHPGNMGKGAAIRTALTMARQPLVVIQDADLEYDPTDLKRLVEPVRSGQAVAVYGSRFFRKGSAQTTTWHALLNRLLTWVTNAVTGQCLTDEATCYKLLPRELLSDLNMQEKGFGFCPEVTAKLSRRGIAVVEVPVDYRARSRAEGKKLRLRDGFIAIYCLLKYSFF